MFMFEPNNFLKLWYITLTITNCALNFFFKIVTELICLYKFVCKDTIEEGTGGCMDMQERLLNVNAQVYTLHSQQCT